MHTSLGGEHVTGPHAVDYVDRRARGPSSPPMARQQIPKRVTAGVFRRWKLSLTPDSSRLFYFFLGLFGGETCLSVQGWVWASARSLERLPFSISPCGNGLRRNRRTRGSGSSDTIDGFRIVAGAGGRTLVHKERPRQIMDRSASRKI